MCQPFHPQGSSTKNCKKAKSFAGKVQGQADNSNSNMRKTLVLASLQKRKFVGHLSKHTRAAAVWSACKAPNLHPECPNPNRAIWFTNLWLTESMNITATLEHYSMLYNAVLPSCMGKGGQRCSFEHPSKLCNLQLQGELNIHARQGCGISWDTTAPKSLQQMKYLFSVQTQPCTPPPPRQNVTL